MKRNKLGVTGFTLLELLVVVLIIGILAAVAFPQYQKAVEKSRAVEILSTVNTISKTAEMYLLSGKTDPISFENLEIDLSGGQLQGTSYYTKTAQYDFQCRYNPTEPYCFLVTYRRNCYVGNVLDPDNCDDSNNWTISREWMNGKIVSNLCMTQFTETGNTICKWLESQGFEFTDNEI